MSVRKHVFEALHIIREPVTARQLYERAVGLRYSPESIECAMRALVRRGFAVELKSGTGKRSGPSRFVLTKYACELADRKRDGERDRGAVREKVAGNKAGLRVSSWFTVTADGMLDDSIVTAARSCGFQLRTRSADPSGMQKLFFEREACDGSRDAG